MKRLYLLFLAAILMPLNSLAVPPEFSAVYQVESHGIVAAQSTYTLSHQGQTLNFSQHSKAVGFAALFGDNTLDENSSLSVKKDQLLLNEYSFVQRGNKENRDIHLSIGWEQSSDDKLHGTIQGTASGNTINANVEQPVWDTLSFQLPMMMNMPVVNTVQQHAVLVKGKVKNYSFISHGEETIDVAGNSIDTIKIEKNTANSNRPFYFWIAPALHNLPVKMEKWKNGKPHITMSLHQARFPANETLRFDAYDDDFNDM